MEGGGEHTPSRRPPPEGERKGSFANLEDCTLAEYEDGDFPATVKAQEGGRIRRVIRRAYHRFLRITGDPRDVALGFSLGIFIGMSPFFGVHTLLAILFATIFRWNRVAAAVGVQITNFATAPLLYGFTYWVGRFFVSPTPPNGGPPAEVSVSRFYDLLFKAPDVVWTMCVGGFVVGLPLAFVAYSLSYKAIFEHREDIRRRFARLKDPLARTSAAG
ncbi:MAG: DUF2062 domain-containing protein [Desulfatibacillaceae bacterium]